MMETRGKFEPNLSCQRKITRKKYEINRRQQIPTVKTLANFILICKHSLFFSAFSFLRKKLNSKIQFQEDTKVSCVIQTHKLTFRAGVQKTGHRFRPQGNASDVSTFRITSEREIYFQEGRH